MIVGIRRAPIRKLRFVLSSIAVSPRIVAVVKTRRPVVPEVRKMIRARKRMIVRDILE